MKIFLGLTAALVQGCVFVPHTSVSYDEQCKIERRQMTLQSAQIGAIGGCSGRECVAVLAALGAVAAASAVISGSIVVVGNVVYWLEKQGKCALA